MAVGAWFKRSDGLGEATLAERWNGSHWVIEPTPAPKGLHGGAFDGVSCTSARACIATATYVNRSRNTTSIAERWNGKAWSVQQIARPVGAHGKKGGVYLTGVSCTARSACTAVGTAFFLSTDRSTTLAERWNGTRWSVQRTPNPSNTQGSNFYGVSCIGMRLCWAVGLNTVPSNSPSSPPTQATLAERWDGSGWTIEHTPTPSITGGSYFQAVSCTSSTSCIAVGASPSSLAPIAEGWNGTRWSVQHTPRLSGTSNGLFGISCSHSTVCTAVGSHGRSPLVERHS